ncbi:PAS domain-containing sensor histidine kinase [Occultella glacieicola]|uniref:Sensor-like histidine kinase SenX3 n=1 Tax=Occultella glacieicola TaxID=2518684 RepID=A0ABY2E403_9MICO|nr:ATP-binding protein [Occultella glacieicola]TDE94142.1 PAS domain-containing sensor histidine kinase [Occultella glacieicola]
MWGSPLRAYGRSFYVNQPRRAATQQTIFIVPVLVVFPVIAVFRPGIFFEPSFLVGVAIIAGVTVACALVPWRRTPIKVLAILPLLDFLAIALCAGTGGAETSALGLLCMFPALWLTLLFDVVGVVISTAATVALSLVPAPLGTLGPVDAFTVVRRMLLPMVIAGVTTMLVLGRSTFRRQRREITDNAQELAYSLQESERSARLLRGIIGALSAGIVVVDSDGNDLISNPAQAEIHALASPPENSDRTEAGHLLFHRDRSTPLGLEARPVRRAIRGESFTGSIMYVGAPGGTQRAVSVSARALVGADGAREGAVVVFTDITDLTDAMRQRETFVSSVSHELRTPITSIIGYLDLIRDDPTPRAADVDDYLDVVERNSAQVLRIVEDLLSQAQATSGNLQLARVPADLPQLVERAILSARPGFEARHVRLEADLAALPNVEVDPSRIIQVLDNLLTNALKYTPAGGRVVVRTCNVPEASEVEVAIEDTGMGMSPAEVDRLFTRFFRTPNARDLAVPGVGLGLAISKEIISAHDGAIAVESTPGKGSIFRVRLPVA